MVYIYIYTHIYYAYYAYTYMHIIYTYICVYTNFKSLLLYVTFFHTCRLFIPTLLN